MQLSIFYLSAVSFTLDWHLLILFGFTVISIILATQIVEEFILDKIIPHLWLSFFGFAVADCHIGHDCRLPESDNEKINFLHQPLKG